MIDWTKVPQSGEMTEVQKSKVERLLPEKLHPFIEKFFVFMPEHIILRQDTVCVFSRTFDRVGRGANYRSLRWSHQRATMAMKTVWVPDLDKTQEAEGKKPMVEVSLFDAADIANNLNKSANLPEAYEKGDSFVRFKDEIRNDPSFEEKGLLFSIMDAPTYESAVRGGSKTHYYQYSGSDNYEEVAHYYDNVSNIKPVMQLKPNELGIYDLSGNVYCWTHTPVEQNGAHKEWNQCIEEVSKEKWIEVRAEHFRMMKKHIVYHFNEAEVSFDELCKLIKTTWRTHERFDLAHPYVISEVKDSILEFWDDIVPYTFQDVFNPQIEDRLKRLIMQAIDPEEMFEKVKKKEIDRKVVPFTNYLDPENPEKIEDTYVLWEFDAAQLKLQDVTGKLKAVECYCTSSGKKHFLFVNNSHTNALDAIASTCRPPFDLKDIIEIYRQGDIFIWKVKSNAKVKAEQTLTGKQYFNLLKVQS
jgi:hypothetical protein